MASALWPHEWRNRPVGSILKVRGHGRVRFALPRCAPVPLLRQGTVSRFGNRAGAIVHTPTVKIRRIDFDLLSRIVKVE